MIPFTADSPLRVSVDYYTADLTEICDPFTADTVLYLADNGVLLASMTEICGEVVIPPAPPTPPLPPFIMGDVMVVSGRGLKRKKQPADYILLLLS